MTSQAVTFTLPRALLINANDRTHWAQKAARTRGLRQLAAWHTNNGPLDPITGRQHITVTYTFRDRRAVRDIANLHPSSKALVDGLQDSGVLPHGDDDAHVLGPDNRLGTPDKAIPVGRVRVEIQLDPIGDAA